MKTKIKKDWYGRLKNIEELHNDSKFWLSEIDFIKDEIHFLNHLLSSNYISLLDASSQEKIDTLIKKLLDDKTAANLFYELIKNHEVILSNLIKTNSALSNPNYLETHKKIEEEIEWLFMKYKVLKKKIFKMVEKIMKKKEQKKLI